MIGCSMFACYAQTEVPSIAALPGASVQPPEVTDSEEVVEAGAAEAQCIHHNPTCCTYFELVAAVEAGEVPVRQMLVATTPTH